MLVVYGLVGLALAPCFWGCYRDRPAEHPRRQRRRAGPDRRATRIPPGTTPCPPACRGWARRHATVSLWLSSLVQFGVNFGWVFLITYLNRYLLEVHELAP